MSLEVLPRSEIKPEYTWNATSLFASRDAWRKEYEAIDKNLPDLQKFQGRLSESPAVLLEWLETAESVFRRTYILLTYTTMASNVDTNDTEAAAMDGQLQGLLGRVYATTAFAQPEILEIGLDKLRQWIKDESRLALYQQNFEDLFRQQAHVRSAEVEEILGMVADPFGSVYNTMSILTNAEIKFEEAASKATEKTVVAQGNINALLNSPDRELRRTAWENYADGYLAVKNTLASNYLTSVKQDVFNTRARRYENTLEAALFGNNIPVSVFHNLIDTYRKNLPTWHRYWEIRRKALKVDKLHPYDIWAPLTTDEPPVSYQQAVDWICEGMKPLGEEYVKIMRQGCLQDRWVDVYPNQGKRQGAFSSGSPGTFPFIMMSFNDDLKSMSTLAHELGHSMHSYFTTHTQPFVYCNYSLFVAEVASNFNQAMVRANLFKTNADPQFQIALIEEAMGNFHRYFFIMPTLACFELEIHARIERGEGVTADEMNSLMADLFSEGYGDAVEVDRDRVGITWAQFGHLYVNYYTFQYATGISGAHALSQKILAGDKNAAEKYLGMLKAGGSNYPTEVLKTAGVDLTTSEPVEKTFEVLSGIVDRLESLVGKS